MNEIIVCRDCVSSDCTGCNMLVLYHALERNRFEALMNENRHLNIDTDVVPVRHGRWIEKIDPWDRQRIGKCSECGQKSYDFMYFYFCPNCGAKMNGDKND